MPRPDNPRFPHTCVITRETNPGPMSDELEAEILYEGVCRAYDKNTTTSKGEVITSNRGLSLPITRKGWMERGVTPREGDLIVVDRGGYEEHGSVIDINPANFGGTHLLWKYDRN